MKALSKTECAVYSEAYAAFYKWVKQHTDDQLKVAFDKKDLFNIYCKVWAQQYVDSKKNKELYDMIKSIPKNFAKNFRKTGGIQKCAIENKK